MRRVKRKGHSLGLIIIRIKGVAIIVVVVEVFPRGSGSQPTTWWRASSNIFAERKLKSGQITKFRAFIKIREIINSEGKDKECACYFF